MEGRFCPNKREGVDERGMGERFMAFRSGWLHPVVDGQSFMGTVVIAYHSREGRILIISPRGNDKAFLQSQSL